MLSGEQVSANNQGTKTKQDSLNKNILELLADLQDQYRENTRQHLYSTYILRKVLHHQKDRNVQLPRRISYWPRKVTADIIKEKLVYDYYDEDRDINLVTAEQEVVEEDRTSNVEALVNSELMAGVQALFYKKLKAKNQNLNEDEFLDFFEMKILPKKKQLTASILNKFDDVLRSMNYEFVSSRGKSIDYTNVLKHCGSIYEEDKDEPKYELLERKCDALFSEKIIKEKYVNNNFKIHGDIIVSDDDEEETEP